LETVFECAVYCVLAASLGRAAEDLHKSVAADENPPLLAEIAQFAQIPKQTQFVLVKTDPFEFTCIQLPKLPDLHDLIETKIEFPEAREPDFPE
jgi:hypothetical protein